jgi:hypothetical protein
MRDGWERMRKVCVIQLLSTCLCMLCQLFQLVQLQQHQYIIWLLSCVQGLHSLILELDSECCFRPLVHLPIVTICDPITRLYPTVLLYNWVHYYFVLSNIHSRVQFYSSVCKSFHLLTYCMCLLSSPSHFPNSVTFLKYFCSPLCSIS